MRDAIKTESDRVETQRWTCAKGCEVETDEDLAHKTCTSHGLRWVRDGVV